MEDFNSVYKQLNEAQRQAVDAVDGPLLVIAGPGTGKTQLLSARVASILKVTDTPPQNVLCLTFTENGAANMRERLTRFIGKEAYDVSISTYHAFGGDLIRRYPEYFSETRLENPVDELSKRQILLGITEGMSYSNPLKQARHHIGDLIGTVSEAKRALLTPEQLRTIAKENLDFIEQANTKLQEIFSSFTTMPRSLDKALPYFEQTLQILSSLAPGKPTKSPYGKLADIAAAELIKQLSEAQSIGKTKPLTEWKNSWLVKNENNQFAIDGSLQNARIRSLATVLEQYQSALEEQGLYDFDDMIIRSIHALENHADLRYTLQERYLYLLLDEFQDTNAAQLRLIELLTNNPVNEGRPNVMAVGDDDQAIYAFQGAQYSNMLDYYSMYRDVRVINLTENYRSSEQIIETAHNIAEQIEARLHHAFPGSSKRLIAAGKDGSGGSVERVEFLSAIAEREYIATRIHQLIDGGVPASNIAVLAPKHKHLEPLVPYLNAKGIPVSYEKRENILEAPVIRQLITMSQLVVALESDNQQLANHLWPQILSYEFWGYPVDTIWQTAWKVSDSRGETTWSEMLLKNNRCRPAALLLLGVAAKVHTETLETLLDYLTGNSLLETNDPEMPAVGSPLRSYYMNPKVQETQPGVFYDMVSHLTVLRARLRDYQRTTEKTLTLRDFLRFIAMYDEAEQPMQSTNPYSQQADAVQLMTVFKAKGLEYGHVFLPACQDEVWGSSSRDNGNKLTLPANLQPIRHAGTTEDERLRILYVAITRARQGLYLTSSLQDFNGKRTKRLKYFDEREHPNGNFHAFVLPEGSREIVNNDATAPELELMETDWRTRHLQAVTNTSLHGLLGERLNKYQVSPTHLTDFINLEYAGPERFFLKTILKFPEAPLPDAQFGSAIHETLEWLQHRANERDAIPSTAEAIEYFKLRIANKRLSEQRTKLEIERGEKVLTHWMKQRSHILEKQGVAERNFHNEGVFYGDVHMAGQVDRMEINASNRTITVVDFKTGKSYGSWKSDPKLYRYRLQLYCYKLLIEGSHSYKDYKVETGRLEFIEPDENGKVQWLELTFNNEEVEEAKQLLLTLWNHVKTLDFPDTSPYPSTITGVKSFVSDLLEGKI